MSEWDESHDRTMRRFADDQWQDNAQACKRQLAQLHVAVARLMGLIPRLEKICERLEASNGQMGRGSRFEE